jgi:hypothetical protein
MPTNKNLSPNYPPLDETALLHAMQDQQTVDAINADRIIRQGLIDDGPVAGDGGPEPIPALKPEIAKLVIGVPTVEESVRIIPIDTPAEKPADTSDHSQIA